MQMTSRERLLATIEGRPVDRLPIRAPIPWHPRMPEPAAGDWKAQPNYRCLVDLVREHADFLVQFDIDQVDPGAAAPIGEGRPDRVGALPRPDQDRAG